MVTASQAEESIYSGRYSYRKPGVFVIGAAGLVMAALLLIWWYRSNWRVGVPFDYRNLLMLLIPAFPGWIGLMLVRSYLQNTAIDLSIDPAGVFYGAKFIPWKRIRGLIIRHSDGHLHFKVCRRGLRSDLCITTDAAATASEAEHLVTRLEQFLKSEHAAIWMESCGV